MSKAVDQIERLRAEIRYCCAHPGVSVHEVAERFAVSDKQVVEDLEFGFYADLPGRGGCLIDLDLAGLEDEGVIDLREVDTITGPARLTAQEAASIQLALTLIEDVASDKLRGEVASLKAKIADAASAVVDQVVDIQVTTGDETVREGLARAIQAGDRIALTYDSVRTGRQEQVVVDPVTVEIVDGVAYLRGFALARDAWRTYALSRVRSVESTGEKSQDHGRPDMDSWRHALLAGEEVVLTLTPEAARMAEAYQVDKPTKRDDALVDMTIRVVNPEWIVRLIMRLSPGVAASQPGVYMERAREQAREMLDAYEGIG
ncbi:MAG: WYL domain-containing protein [Propionibacteriaceae bacterium]|jgi:proteasome accessory factor C|nr:WYL domain-containing protein [Propionibacteriaceae bacterium]